VGLKFSFNQQLCEYQGVACSRVSEQQLQMPDHPFDLGTSKTICFEDHNNRLCSRRVNISEKYSGPGQTKSSTELNCMVDHEKRM